MFDTARFLFFVVVIVLSSSRDLAAEDLPELQTVPQVNISKYLGKWYEVARFPHRFQEGCVRSTATYILREDGDIDVLNECQEANGKLRSKKGLAWVTDPKTNSKLRVRFFWPFSGKYWIIDLGKNYEYAVIGHPDRDYLWILSRTPSLPDAIYQGILERLQTQHYDLTLLQKNPSTEKSLSPPVSPH